MLQSWWRGEVPGSITDDSRDTEPSHWETRPCTGPGIYRCKWIL